ncbi:hypothetical protein evm_002982 [Chilo suppressalis]|nr:hypothetical protein evm_002982 [Chilo suppressalis]
MAEVEWTNDTVKRLVQEYKLRPMLWNSSHELYRAQNAKYEAYMELANVFECDVVDLRKKLNSILASHRREKAKVRGGARSTWFLYQHLSFLPGHLEMNESHVKRVPKRKILAESGEEEEDEEEAFSGNADDDDKYEEEEVIIKREAEPTFRTKKHPRLIRGFKPRLTKARPVAREVTTSQLDNRLIEALKLLRRSDLSRKKDECDSFGEYIAVSLRKHDERTQSMIKQAINNILFEQEMKKYNATQYVVISEMDENPLTLGDNDNQEK